MHDVGVGDVKPFGVGGQSDHGVANNRQHSPQDTTGPVAVLVYQEPSRKHKYQPYTAAGLKQISCKDKIDGFMMTSSNGNIFLVTGPLCGEFTAQR